MITGRHCQTTLTMRYEVGCGCRDPEYPDNYGPCATYVRGATGNCVYCEHPAGCHELVKAALREELAGLKLGIA